MIYKRFIKRFLLLSSLVIGFLLALNLSVDPYNKYGINVFHIKYKLSRDDRAFKIGQLKQLKQIDNLILGSSRSQTLDPTIISEFLSGITYNFGVGGGTIEDSLGILLYLEKENKLPKNILLCLDFSAFNTNNKTHSKFFNSKELNFIKSNVNNFDIAHFLSIDTTRSSIKTLRMHIKSKNPEHYFNKYGFMVSSNNLRKTDLLQDDDVQIARIKTLSNSYFQTQYSNGNLVLDIKRFEYYKQLIDIAKRYNINLKVILTPIHNYQLLLIEKNSKLNNTLKQFLFQLQEIHPFYNFMRENKYSGGTHYFVDSVHYKKTLGDIMLTNIYGNQTNNDFGIIVKSEEAK